MAARRAGDDQPGCHGPGCRRPGRPGAADRGAGDLRAGPGGGVGRDRRPRAPEHAPVAVGAALAVGVLVAGGVTGGAVNPVRALGPALVAGQFASLWVYLVGPVLGGALAAVLYDRFLGKAVAPACDARGHRPCRPVSARPGAARNEAMPCRCWHHGRGSTSCPRFLGGRCSCPIRRTNRGRRPTICSRRRDRCCRSRSSKLCPVCSWSNPAERSTSRPPGPRRRPGHGVRLDRACGHRGSRRRGVPGSGRCPGPDRRSSRCPQAVDRFQARGWQFVGAPGTRGRPAAPPGGAALPVRRSCARRDRIAGAEALSDGVGSSAAPGFRTECLRASSSGAQDSLRGRGGAAPSS